MHLNRGWRPTQSFILRFSETIKCQHFQSQHRMIATFPTGGFVAQILLILSRGKGSNPVEACIFWASFPKFW